MAPQGVKRRLLKQQHVHKACRWALAAAVLGALVLVLRVHWSIAPHVALPRTPAPMPQQQQTPVQAVKATAPLPKGTAPSVLDTLHPPLRIAALPPAPSASQHKLVTAINEALRAHSPPWVEWQAQADTADVLLHHISNCSAAVPWSAARQGRTPLAGGQAVVLLQHTLRCSGKERRTLLRESWRRALLAVGPHDLEAYAAQREPQMQGSLRLWSMPWGEECGLLGGEQGGEQGCSSRAVASSVGMEKLLLVAVAGAPGAADNPDTIAASMAALLAAADQAGFKLQPLGATAATALSQECGISASIGMSCHHKDGHQHLLQGTQLHDAIRRAQYVVLLQQGDAWEPLALTAAFLGTRLIKVHEPQEQEGQFRWLKPYATILHPGATREALQQELSRLLQPPHTVTAEVAQKALGATFSWQALIPALFDRIWAELQLARFPQTVDEALLLLPALPALPAGQYEHDQRAMARLLDECVKRGNHTIAWDLSRERAEPGACAPVDVIMPHMDRGHGLCQDAVQYIYHLQGRLVSLQLLASKVLVRGELLPYPTACPNTVWLNLEAVYPEVLAEVDANPARRIWYMVNHETFNKNVNKTTKLLTSSDRLLMKSRDGYTRLQAWLQHNAANLPRRGDKVLTFTSHSTLDPTVGMAPGQQMDFTHALQISGGSGLKHTPELMHGWARNPDLPLLTLTTHGAHLHTLFDEYANNSRDLGYAVGNMHMLRTITGNDVIRRLVTGIGIHICTSGKEGFGHYINQARAAGALVLATDYPPMNELVGPYEEYGLACRYTALWDEPTELLGPAGSPYLPRIDVHFEPDEIIACVRRALALPVAERRRRGAAARARYLAEQRLFVAVMQKLRIEAAAPRAAAGSVVDSAGGLPGSLQQVHLRTSD